MTHTSKLKAIRPILALSLVSSIALSSLVATPAIAGGASADSGRFIAGVVALGLLGVVINDASRRGETGHHYRGVHPSKQLPDYCLKSYDTRRGSKQMFNKSCLQDNFPYWNRLPEQCETSIRYRNRRDRLRFATVYKPHCLQDWGYHVVHTH